MTHVNTFQEATCKKSLLEGPYGRISSSYHSAWDIGATSYVPVK